MPEYMLFSVTDHGGGIAAEDRQRAFHRMYRADHPLVVGLGETGVGLSIAKALVEAQGGRIWIDSVSVKSLANSVGGEQTFYGGIAGQVA